MPRQVPQGLRKLSRGRAGVWVLNCLFAQPSEIPPTAVAPPPLLSAELAGRACVVVDLLLCQHLDLLFGQHLSVCIACALYYTVGGRSGQNLISAWAPHWLYVAPPAADPGAGSHPRAPLRAQVRLHGEVLPFRKITALMAQVGWWGLRLPALFLVLHGGVSGPHGWPSGMPQHTAVHQPPFAISSSSLPGAAQPRQGDLLARGAAPALRRRRVGRRARPRRRARLLQPRLPARLCHLRRCGPLRVG